MSNPVKIYPIACQLLGPKGTFSVNILKLVQTGFLVNSLDQTLKVNDQFTATFVLPVKNIFIESPVVVFKTYDQFKGAHGLVKPGHHVNELLFQNMSTESKKSVTQFLDYVRSAQA